jgi:hypothetical protein
MDLVCKDVGLFDKLTKKYKIPAEISNLIYSIFKDGKKILGNRALSTSIVKILEKKCNDDLRAEGFPSILKDKNNKKIAKELKI